MFVCFLQLNVLQYSTVCVAKKWEIVAKSRTKLQNQKSFKNTNTPHYVFSKGPLLADHSRRHTIFSRFFAKIIEVKTTKIHPIDLPDYGVSSKIFESSKH